MSSGPLRELSFAVDFQVSHAITVELSAATHEPVTHVQQRWSLIGVCPQEPICQQLTDPPTCALLVAECEIQCTGRSESDDVDHQLNYQLYESQTALTRVNSNTLGH